MRIIVFIVVRIFVLTLPVLLWSFGHPREGLQLPVAETPFTREQLDHLYEPFGYVAHALGTIDGTKYSNSLEAFQRSYDLGFRLFEVDLVLLADGSVLAAHDGMEGDYGLDKPFSQADQQSVSPKFRGRYTVLFERDLLRLVEEHPDTFMILDPKGEQVSDLTKLVQRLIEVGRQHHLTLPPKTSPS